ncbi:MAG: CBS domain-containing protein [Desulfobacterales bacterium]|nr:CBS domain-containing protein [Desulfobacterales bacterium]
MDDTIGTIHEILKRAEFHHLLVVKDRKLVGIISDRDTLKSISPFIGKLSEHSRDVSILDRKVHQIMTRKVITVEKSTSIETAANLLLDNNISCLPVTSTDGEVEGVVTWKDILGYYINKK